MQFNNPANLCTSYVNTCYAPVIFPWQEVIGSVTHASEPALDATGFTQRGSEN